ncbi:MAG: hypothetical protein JW763_10220 [candidate division Zixibacteria bacterium]|nr:hypothetical protein [candidate division Zixibacteria bacterium]
MSRQAGLLILAIAVLLILQSCGKGIDDIYAENVKARGGIDSISALQSMKITGGLVTDADRFGFIIWARRPDCIRMNIEADANDLILASDGDTLWFDTPYDTHGALPMPPAEATKLKEMYDVLFGLLQTCRERGDSMVLLGQEKVGEREAYKIQSTSTDGVIQEIYVDAETYLENKRQSSAVYAGKDVVTITLYENYQTVAGVMIPHASKEYINDRLDHTTVFDNIEANIEMSDTLFVVPDSTP